MNGSHPLDEQTLGSPPQDEPGSIAHRLQPSPATSLASSQSSSRSTMPLPHGSSLPVVSLFAPLDVAGSPSEASSRPSSLSVGPVVATCVSEPAGPSTEAVGSSLAPSVGSDVDEAGASVVVSSSGTSGVT